MLYNVLKSISVKHEYEKGMCINNNKSGIESENLHLVKSFLKIESSFQQRNFPRDIVYEEFSCSHL